MGNEYNHHLHHRSSYLPILCSRSSIKDARLSKWDGSSAASSSDEPLSPRVSCMGQVKRTNRVVGFPTPHRFTSPTPNATHNNSTVRYHKLKRLFSSRSLICNTAAATTTVTTATRSGRRRMIVGGAGGPKLSDDYNGNCTSINVVDLDPPLPVIKRAPQPAGDCGEAVNLWQRRSGGVALKSLQLQRIHLPHHHSLQPTSV